jgi:hypothetical protein
VLAQLFMHYAFDTWLAREFLLVRFERYADGAVRPGLRPRPHASAAGRRVTAAEASRVAAVLVSWSDGARLSVRWCQMTAVAALVTTPAVGAGGTGRLLTSTDSARRDLSVEAHLRQSL